jgi:hypothetical protein
LARQFFEQLHGASTLGTENSLGPGFRLVGCVLVVSEIAEWDFNGRCETQPGFELSELGPLLGAEEAVVAQLGEAVGQDMLKEAADELRGRQGDDLLGFGVSVLISKSDLGMVKFEDAIVAEGHPKEIRRQIFEHGLSAAGRFTVHDPVLLPGLRRHLAVEGSFLEGITELGAEDLAESFDGRQKSGMLGGKPLLGIGGEAASGHQIMDMGMVVEIAGPGLEDTEEAELATHPTGVEGELLQSRRGSTEQEIVNQLLVAAGEFSQEVGESEGHQEVGHG